ncbi:MAG: GDP-mannose 4,6-dehydratase [Blastocatellia bacterium]
MKKALICGISGQDGAYLAQLLLGKGYQVFGSSRDAQVTHFDSLKRLEIKERVKLESVSLIDFRSVLQALIKIQPDEIYNLAGQTSVGLSFQQPVETLESIATGTLNLLEAIRFTERSVKFYNAASGECFGDTGSAPAHENTPFRPRSPYAVAKATAFWETVNYREAYGLHSCSGILFNHESSLRPKRFVTKKIISTVCQIAQGKASHLRLGNLSVTRDWGWAPEYVEAMWLIMQQEAADDYIIATGESNSLQSFVETAFAFFDLDWKDYVVIDEELLRPTDIIFTKADPSKAEKKLGWKAKHRMKDVVKMMLQAELAENPGMK